jgi:hypothetical protein
LLLGWFRRGILLCSQASWKATANPVTNRHISLFTPLPYPSTHIESKPSPHLCLSNIIISFTTFVLHMLTMNNYNIRLRIYTIYIIFSNHIHAGIASFFWTQIPSLINIKIHLCIIVCIYPHTNLIRHFISVCHHDGPSQSTTMTIPSSSLFFLFVRFLGGGYASAIGPFFPHVLRSSIVGRLG